MLHGKQAGIRWQPRHTVFWPQITAEGERSRDIKRRLLPGNEATTNLDSLLKRRDITLRTKVHPVKAMVFSGVTFVCESWTIKTAECHTTLLQHWRRLSGVPLTARRSNQSILKEISPEYSLEGLMMKLQYFGHLLRRTDSLEKTLMLGQTEDRRRW